MSAPRHAHALDHRSRPVQPMQPMQPDRACQAGHRYGRGHPGFSLIEMLVALALGVLVLGAAVAWAGRHLGEHQRTVLELQLQQDLRAVAATVQRQLRPLGQLDRPEDVAGAPAPPNGSPSAPSGSTRGTNSPSSPADGDPALRVEDRGRRLLFRRPGAEAAIGSDDDTNASSDGPPPPVEAATTDGGFRLSSDRLSQLMGGRFQALHDPALLRITAFRAELVERPRPMPELCASGCPGGPPTSQSAGIATCPPVLREQALRLTMQGQSARDAGVRHTLEWLTVLPNALFEGACP